MLWPPDLKNWLIRKDSDAGKDWRQEEKEMSENEILGWHRWLNGHEFEQTLGDSEGQGSLACYSPWGHKELDMTEGLNWTEGLLTYWAHWAGCGSHATIVLLFGVTSHASVAWFYCDDVFSSSSSLVAKSCPTLATPWTVSSLPGSSVLGILQTGILEWVAIPFSRGSCRPRDQPGSPAL